METTVIICTHNRAESLRVVLGDLRRTHSDCRICWEVLVVDNCSNDNTSQVVQEFAAEFPVPVRYIHEPRKGKSYALNTAIDATRGKYLLFTDDDVTIEPTWIRSLRQGLIDRPCAAVGGRILPDWKAPKPIWLCESGPFRLIDATSAFDRGDEPKVLTEPPFGANVAYHRWAFEKYGRFRTDLGPSGRSPVHGEDTEFCRRLLAQGELIWYEPSAVVHHPVEPHRVSKKYYREVYYWMGVRSVRLEGCPQGNARFFGVPRYLFRRWIEEGARALLTLDARRRFYHELQWYAAWGAIAEWRRRDGDVSSCPAAGPECVDVSAESVR